MQLTCALMLIKLAANRRFTVLLVCARPACVLVGHVPVNGAIAGTREDAMTVPVCPAGRRRRRVRGHLACAAAAGRSPYGLRVLGRKVAGLARAAVLLGTRGDGWCRVGGADENVRGVSAMGRAKMVGR